MTLSDVVSMALANLGRRKGRTALTVSGVIIGVAALVLMVSLGLGLQQAVRVVFESDKSLRSLYVTRPVTGGKKSKRFTGFSPFGSQTMPLTEKEMAELRGVPGVEFVIPGLNLVVDADFPELSDAFYPGVWVGVAVPGEEAWLKSALKAGTVWESPSERAVLIPTRFLSGRFELKPEQVLGRRIVFSRGGEEASKPAAEEVTYTVVGVIETDKLGLRAAGVLVPSGPGEELRGILKGGYLLQGKPGTYPSVWVTSRTSEELGPVKNRLQNLGYDVVTTADVLDIINTLFLVINGFFAAVGAIGLLVALLGIANTMAMAVLERTREIGIMKAVGARNADIRRVYLMEAAGIGVIGGLLGLAGGVVLGRVLNAIAHGVFQQIPDEVSLFRVPILLAAGALVFATGVSMLAGLLPALRASRLDPVRSLRYE